MPHFENKKAGEKITKIDLPSESSAETTRSHFQSINEDLKRTFPTLEQNENELIPVNSDLQLTSSPKHELKKNVVFRTIDNYFRSKPFELKNKGEFYEILGIRGFKKFLLNGGDYSLRLLGMRTIKQRGRAGLHKTEQELIENEKMTRALEAAHIPIITYGLSYTGMFIQNEKWVPAGISILLNIAVNIYPIMTQRYNRARYTYYLDRIRQRREKNLLRATKS